MTLGKRMYWVAGLVALMVLAGASLTLTSRLTSAGNETPTGTADTVVPCSDPSGADDDAAEADGTPDTDAIEEQCGPQDEAGDASEANDGETEDASAGAGVLDDGKDLLPQAGISLDAAIAAAQGAAAGDLGEVDLEDYNGKLAFNVDIGGTDVKVDASNGTVLAADQSDGD